MHIILSEANTSFSPPQLFFYIFPFRRNGGGAGEASQTGTHQQDIYPDIEIFRRGQGRTNTKFTQIQRYINKYQTNDVFDYVFLFLVSTSGFKVIATPGTAQKMKNICVS